MITLECKDCGGTIFFNQFASGTMAKEPTISHCKCVDRDTHPSKKCSNVIHREYATFIPDYLKNKPYNAI